MCRSDELDMESSESDVPRFGDPSALRQLGESMFRRGRWISALRYFEAVRAVQADINPLVVYRMAVCCSRLNRTEEAERHFRQALSEDSMPQVHRDYAQHLLLNGRFEQGWVHYRRGRGAEPFVAPMSLSAKEMLWDGRYRPGSVLEIVCESRLSEQILFAAFFPELLVRARAAGMRVVVSCHSTLVRLFQSSFREATVVTWELYGGRLHDLPIGSAGRQWMKTRQSDLPGYLPLPKRGAYLRPSVDDVGKVRSLLRGEQAGLRVGLVDPRGNRDTRLESGLSGLSVVRAQLCGMPRAIRVFELNTGREGSGGFSDGADRLGRELLDMSSVAALMQEMDVVVGVDSPEVNVSGALGCETRVLLGKHAEWHWGKEDEECGWYPHAKGYRDWPAGSGSSPVEQLLTELEEMSVATASVKQQR